MSRDLTHAAQDVGCVAAATHTAAFSIGRKIAPDWWKNARKFLSRDLSRCEVSKRQKIQGKKYSDLSDKIQVLLIAFRYYRSLWIFSMFMRHVTEGRPRLEFPWPARSIRPSCASRSVARRTFCSVMGDFPSSFAAHFPMLSLLAQHSFLWMAKTLIAARIGHKRPLSDSGGFWWYMNCILVSALCRPAWAVDAACVAVAPSITAACSAHLVPFPFAWPFHASRPSVISTLCWSPCDVPVCCGASMFMMSFSSATGAEGWFECRNCASSSGFS